MPLSLAIIIAHFGLLDGSAGVAVDQDSFLTASDEMNLIYFCSTAGGQNKQPEIALNLNDQKDWFKPDTNKEGEFKEADLESCTRREGSDIIYWISSHARDKGKKDEPSKVKPERQRFFATRLTAGPNPKLTPEGAVCFTLLDDMLKSSVLAGLKLSDAAAKAPDVQGGLNIESLCAQHESERLFIGLRNPIPEGKAVLVPLRNAPALFGGTAKHAEFDPPILLNLQGLGLRDMIWWPEKKSYLMIGGHYGEHLTKADAPRPRLFTWSGKAGEDPVVLRLDPEFEKLNPEGLVHFSDGRVLLLSDDGAMIADGGKEQKDLLKNKTRKLSELSFRSVWLTSGS